MSDKREGLDPAALARVRAELAVATGKRRLDVILDARDPEALVRALPAVEAVAEVSLEALIAKVKPAQKIRKSPSAVAPPLLAAFSARTPPKATAIPAIFFPLNLSWPIAAASSSTRIGVSPMTSDECATLVRLMPSTKKIWFRATPTTPRKISTGPPISGTCWPSGVATRIRPSCSGWPRC